MAQEIANGTDFTNLDISEIDAKEFALYIGKNYVQERR